MVISPAPYESFSYIFIAMTDNVTPVIMVFNYFRVHMNFLTM